MDWVSNSNPFIYPDRVDDFECEDSDPNQRMSPQTDSPKCQAIERHSAAVDPEPTILESTEEWNDWTSPTSPLFTPAGHTSGKPSDGFCILFIPRAAKARLRNLGSPDDGVGEDASGFTDLPIKKMNWEKVADTFCLPGHFSKAASRRLLSVISVQRTCYVSGNKNRVWMHTATTKSDDDRGEQLDGFAIAATHIESRCFTYAVMVGCSSEQIRKVRRLVRDWEECARHPLLMLGVCAELHLERLAALVKDRSAEYKALMDELNGSMEKLNGSKFHWPTIKKVQEVREKSKSVEEDINTTRSQLSKACLSGVETLIEQHKTSQASRRSSTQANMSPSGQTPPSPAGQTPPSSAGQTPPSSAGQKPSSPASQTTAPSTAGQAVMTAGTPGRDDAIETTALLNERFQDILSRLDGLAAECRLCVEGISFSTDVIRSELARQEAATSADNTAYGTAFALMAAIYLPTTAVATIFAMPIFGWTNDWRHWRYSPVIKSSSGGSSSSGSDAGDQSDQPVVSGYIWLWLAFSVGLSLITFSVFYLRTYRKLRGSKSRNPGNVGEEV